MNTKAFAAFGVLVLLLLNPLQAAAGELGAASPRLEGIMPEQNAGSSVTVSLAELGYADSELVGPFDITRKIFSMPTHWQMLPGGTIVLDFDVAYSGSDIALIGSSENALGALTVSFNNRIVGYIGLGARGSQTISFPIPPEAVTSIRESGQHELTIKLNARSDCDYDIRTVVTLKATSRFDLLFEVLAPELTLARLPAPFYLRNALLPDRTIVVVPDEPSSAELQAAMNVMAGFGSMVGRVYDFQLVPLSGLTAELTASSHLAFVGMPGGLPLLDEIGFPVPMASGAFVGLPPEAANDGIVELAHSPWNEGKVIMLVSGNSGEAVLKAAQAVGSGKIFIYQNPALAYVSSVEFLAGNIPIVEDFTLQDLGYDTVIIKGIGVDQADFTFYVSKEQLAAQDGLLDLVYYHSGLLNYGVSSFSVELNGQLIASRPFSAETEQITNLQVKLPPGLLRFGENRLRITARMQPDLSCDFSGFSDPWLAISNLTSMHLPVSPVDEAGGAFLLDLKNYPGMFATHSNLGDVAFVLPKADPASWKIAADLAYHLGSQAAPPIPSLAVAYADDVPEALRSDFSLILVGKASALPLLEEFNASLPAPFDTETNTAVEKGMQIVYRLPPGVSVGYLELIASPYNSEKMILLVSGNTEDGVAMSGAALMMDQLKDQLTGAFAVTNGVQVAVGESVSHFSVVGTLVPGSEKVVSTPLPTASPAPASSGGPPWLLPFLIVSGIVVLGILAYVIVGAFRRNRLPEFEKTEDSSETTAGDEEKA